MRMHGFNFKCYNCCCSCCTYRHCPYKQGRGAYQYRCKDCVQANGENYGRILECDYFENKYTSARHYKIVKYERKQDEVVSMLKLIMQKLEIAEPAAEQPEHNYIDDDTKAILKKYGY